MEKELQIISLIDSESLERLRGKHLVLYDSHHGTAYRLTGATVEAIQRLYNQYTVIMVIQ